MPTYPQTPGSKRGYLSQAELSNYMDITTVTGDIDTAISEAEEMIDWYLGTQNTFLKQTFQGRVSEVGQNTKTTFTLETIYKNSYPYPDYFIGLTVEFLTGANAGARKKITASQPGGIITTEALTNDLQVNDVYKIYQLGKFPRLDDVFCNTYETPPHYYKSIPEEVKRATAQQVEYMQQMGEEFFASDASEKNAERIGDYSYNKNRMGGRENLIAPKARLSLRSFQQHVGEIELD